MIAVDESEIEHSSLGQETRQRDLRLVLYVINERANAGFLEVLEAATGEAAAVRPVRLVGVDRDVSRVAVPVREQRLTDVESRDAIGEPDLDRVRRVLAADPRAERLTQRRRGSDGKDLLATTILARDGRAPRTRRSITPRA